ncbi:MAG: hypothetical protein QOF44_5967 [Streptomyces sp.]|nr:hypothetical protein [Streptomyces sp.]
MAGPVQHRREGDGELQCRDRGDGEGGDALSSRDLTVTANGQPPLTLTRGPGDTLSAVVSAPNTDLMAGGRFSTPITVLFGRGGTYSARPQRGDLTLTAELLAQGYAPLQPSGVRTGIWLRDWAVPVRVTVTPAGGGPPPGPRR